MKIPKEIQKLLDEREELAMSLTDVSSRLDSWLAKNGADLTNSDLVDSTVTGCMIYIEPGSAKMNVENYIKNRM